MEESGRQRGGGGGGYEMRITRMIFSLSSIHSFVFPVRPFKMTAGVNTAIKRRMVNLTGAIA